MSDAADVTDSESFALPEVLEVMIGLASSSISSEITSRKRENSIDDRDKFH